VKGCVKERNGDVTKECGIAFGRNGMGFGLYWTSCAESY